MTSAYHIVVDGLPAPDGPRFIEVENDAGRSISSGVWRSRPDGLAELVLPAPELAHPIDTAPAGAQIIAHEPMYGWLIVCKQRDGSFLQKSSGNFWMDVPPVIQFTHWLPYPGSLTRWQKTSAPDPETDDSRPRYTAKRLRDEIAKAKEHARREALEEAAQLADGCADRATTFMKERLGGHSIDFQRFSEGCISAAAAIREANTSLPQPRQPASFGNEGDDRNAQSTAAATITTQTTKSKIYVPIIDTPKEAQLLGDGKVPPLPDVERDYPAEFEAWWDTCQHRNRDLADYNVKKQIAWEAFYFVAAPDRRAPAPQMNLRVKPLTKTQIETLANNIHNVNEYAYTVECLTHHLYEGDTAPQTNKRASDFPPSCCTAWEDCEHDGICHDRQQCRTIGPNDTTSEGSARG